MKLTDQQLAHGDVALQALRGISRKLPGAEEYVMVHHPAFRVGKKPYAIAGMNQGAAGGATVSINLGPEAQSALLDDERFSKTPYIGKHGWVTILFRDLRDGELSALVLDSYRRIASKKQLVLLASSPRVAPAAKAARTAKKAAKQPAAKAPRSNADRASAKLSPEQTWRALGLSAPARRALQHAGIESLRDLSRKSERAVSELHGMGPTGVKLLAAALTKAKLRFAK